VKGKGVFITVVDRALSDPSIQDLYVAGNNPSWGAFAGRYIKDTLGTGNVVVIRGLPIVIDEERSRASTRRSRAAASRCWTSSSATGAVTTPSR